ncbi:Acyltransferase family [Salmonella enterica]|nr:Acyltransferase family [Salmonella enterica]
MVVVLSHLTLIFYPQLHDFYKSTLPKNNILYIIHNSPFSFFYSGTGAVFVFFCLSGYVLISNIFTAKDKTKKIISSAIKRYPRLSLPAVCSCILFWGVVNLFNIRLNNVSQWFSDVIYKDFNLLDSILYGGFESFIYGTAKYNPVLWTMQIELIGSFLLFLFCYFNVFDGVIRIVSSILLLNLFEMNVYIFLGLVSFIVGAIIYIYNIYVPKTYNCLLLVFGLYCIGVHENSYSYSWVFYIANCINSSYVQYVYPFFNFCGGIIVVISIVKNDLFKSFFSFSFLILLGELSFSIYLIHLCMIYLFIIPFFNVLISLEFNFWLVSFLCVLTTFIVLLPASFLFFKCIDKTSIKISNKIVSFFQLI